MPIEEQTWDSLVATAKKLGIGERAGDERLPYDAHAKESAPAVIKLLVWLMLLPLRILWWPVGLVLGRPVRRAKRGVRRAAGTTAKVAWWVAKSGSGGIGS